VFGSLNLRGSIKIKCKIKKEDFKMKRLVLFVVALVFAFSTTVMAADKPAVAPTQEQAVAAEKADVKVDQAKVKADAKAAKAEKKAAAKKAKAEKKAAKKKAKAEKKAAEKKADEAAEVK
jgi:Skp family chaperone for outer membrane proteins